MKKWVVGLLALVSLVGAVAIILSQRDASLKTEIVVYKSPTCGCCTKWEEHLRQAGFEVVSHKVDNINGVKAQQGVPDSLWSCHTAVVNGYVVEGHVPASSIKKLLKEKPANVAGLSVPGMPIGSPGMEGPNPENYDVLTFTKAGQTNVWDRF